MPPPTPATKPDEVKWLYMYHVQNEKWFHDRKSPRLKNHDYSTPNYYFVTICTHEKKCIFGSPGMLNDFGKIAEEGLKKISEHYSGVKIEKSVVMPNHIHAIVVLTQDDENLCTVIGSYKSFVTRNIHKIDSGICVWQVSFHDHVIRNQQSYEKIWEYIENNPLKWEEDCFCDKN